MLDSAKSASRVTRLKIDKSNKNIVALLALISIGISGLTLFLQIIVLGSVFSIAKKPAPSLVQLSDGQAIKVQAMGNQERSLDVVQRFTTDALIMLMSWTNELPTVNGEPKAIDQGSIVKIKQGEKRITTAAFQSSFTFSDNLRDELVKILAEMTPPEVFTGEVKTTLKFQHVTLPIPLDNAHSGQWKINVIATLLQYQRGRGDTTKIPFNKEIVVQAIDTPSLPKGGKFSNELEALVYSIRQAGLEIVSMKDIQNTDAQQPLAPGQSSQSFMQKPTTQFIQP